MDWYDDPTGTYDPTTYDPLVEGPQHYPYQEQLVSLFFLDADKGVEVCAAHTPTQGSDGFLELVPHRKP